MKIMSIGAGFVSEHLPYERIDQRIYSLLDIHNMLEKHQPDVLINCIGKTGRPNVDWCESHKEDTSFANTAIPIMLANACESFDTHLIQIGSGCIYFGESPNFEFDTCKCMGNGCNHAPPLKVDLGWKEDDFANPKSYYSKTKYACDLALGAISHVTTLRIRMPISSKNNSRNFINKIRGYNQVIDIPNSVTFMDDLVRCVDWASTTKQPGIFHVTNPTPLSAADVMREYQKYVPDHKFTVIDEAELDRITVAKRSNCIINSRKLLKAGFRMTPTENALQDCMAAYIKNI